MRSYFDEIRGRLNMVVTYRFGGNKSAFARAIRWEGDKDLKQVYRVLAGPPEGTDKVPPELVRDTVISVDGVTADWLRTGIGAIPDWVPSMENTQLEKVVRVPVVDFECDDGNVIEIQQDVMYVDGRIMRRLAKGRQPKHLKMYVPDSSIMMPLVEEGLPLLFTSEPEEIEGSGERLIFVSRRVFLVGLQRSENDMIVSSPALPRLWRRVGGNDWQPEGEDDVVHTVKVLGRPIAWVSTYFPLV